MENLFFMVVLKLLVKDALHDKDEFFAKIING